MRVDSWKQVEDADVVPKQSPEVQVAEPEHKGNPTFVSVMVTPFLTTLTCCPPVVVLKDVAVGELNVAEIGTVVTPPHCPATVAAPLRLVPDWVIVTEPLMQQH
jgi:hypothetical protein